FVALIGWRLIPRIDDKSNSSADLMKLEGYTAELVVPEKSPIIGKEVNELYPQA
ncbi:MAG: hypothetical protein GTO60_02810, partial [Gammaproteobacteria bacterium]|nr:hypothetical protein [Gammaproteobacteria bacterium]NIO61469.1 hypothetical protein [Gammaproteobacteria bacterium]